MNVKMTLCAYWEMFQILKVSNDVLFSRNFQYNRFKLQKGEQVIVDSGYIYDNLIAGGRLGVYTHGQSDVIWSRLAAKCLPRYLLCFLVYFFV